MGLLDETDEFSQGQLEEAIVQAASSRGVAVGWDELEKGIDFLAKGTQVHYSGLTGPILLQPCGERRSGLTEPWSIEDGEIQEGQR
jgi:hypothetical protein